MLASFTTAVGPKVKMKIFVVDENSAIIAGATVIVYGSFEDYKKEVNAIATGVTNKKGSVEFKNLEEKKYYLQVKKGDLNNNGGDNETDVLHLNGKNRFEIMID